MPSQEDEAARRIAQLVETDEQFADARPDAAVSAAISQPGLRLSELVHTVWDSYASRPALGQRAVRFTDDPATGRTSLVLSNRFDTITYGQLGERVKAVAAVLAEDRVRPGDRVCILGFTSVDYTTVELALVLLGAVSVPLQSGAGLEQLRHVIAETEPTIIACSVENLALASELAEHSDTNPQLVVFDYHHRVDDHRETLEAARARFRAAGAEPSVEVLDELMARGKTRCAPDPAAIPHDPLALIIYTSGSTGTPKGAMHLEHLVARCWRAPAQSASSRPTAHPSITLNFRPMSHVVGRMVLWGTLGVGGTAYFVAKSDLSTFLEDLALVRPTQLNFVPRVWQMLFERFQRDVERHFNDGEDRRHLEARIMAEQRKTLFGGRYVAASTGSAPISPNLKTWVESLLDIPVTETFGCTESIVLLANGRVQRPPVIDYKLVDVPELGYLHTDQPHPRGELVVKSDAQFAGYYRRPDVTAIALDSDGFYSTGDIMAQTGPDQLAYVDRRNSVLKLSQGEFVAVSRLQALLGASPLVHQIYLYGNGERSYLLAVVVPTTEALARYDPRTLRGQIEQSLRDVATAAGLQPFEIPRDFIVETTPFTVRNGLLTDIGKPVTRKLKERYGPQLERLYVDLARGQTAQLRGLHDADDRPVLETLVRAVTAVLGTGGSGHSPDARFSDLGGDSLSALTLSNILQDVLHTELPVGVITSPTTTLQDLATYVERQRNATVTRPNFATVHGDGRTELRASDLTLDKFVDPRLLADGARLPAPRGHARTVLLTGATGYLGRFLALQWLERLAPADGTLICLVRAEDDAAAARRLDRVFDSGDPHLLTHYRQLARTNLHVIAGDKGAANLGLDDDTWQRLADTVDVIVDPAAMVNHVLPYRQLFGPNVVGTAELIRLAIATRLKPYSYLSTIAVGGRLKASELTECADIRSLDPTRVLDDGYANGYANSKWASEVLLREAHDATGLPVTVYRCDMILADTRYRGQLNLPDRLTRLILSLLATGIAPASFYQLDERGRRQRAHYDGLPVDFIAEALTSFGEHPPAGFATYNVSNPHDDGIGLDEYVDWLIDAGNPITRIPDYAQWYRRIETALRELPDEQRQRSVLPLLRSYHAPLEAAAVGGPPADRFQAAVRRAGIGLDSDIPHVTAQNIAKYATDLRLLRLL